MVRVELRKLGGNVDDEAWGAKLVDKLLHLTHRQWILRNTETHFKLPDGWSLAQHKGFFNNALVEDSQPRQSSRQTPTSAQNGR